MFSLLTRLLLLTQKVPKLVIAIAFLLSLLSIYPIFNLRWELSLPDLLPKEHPAIATQDLVLKKFGGWQTLIVLSKSKDSAANANFISSLALALQKSPLVNLAEYRTEVDFYNEHKFLYINFSDLETINERIKRLSVKQKKKLNPFIVELVNEEPALTEESFSLEDIEQKYLTKLKDFRGNTDGTIRVLEIYPSNYSLSLADMRKLYDLVKTEANSLNGDNSIEVLYGGAIYDFVAKSRTILAEVRLAAWISAGLLLAIFIFACFKIPAISLIVALCLAMAMLWTFASASLLFGRVNVFTLLIGLVIPALGGRNATHLLSRYAEEIQKGLGVRLALESTMLGMGQPFAVSAFLSASMLLCLTYIPLQGIKELGIAGGLGILFDWLAISIVLPAILIKLQEKRKFKIYAKIIPKLLDFSPRPFKINKKIAIVILLATALLASKGIFPKMEYRFLKMEFPPASEPVPKILKSIGEYSAEPIIVLFPNAKQAEMAVNSYPRINWVTLASLLPREQDKKFTVLREMHSVLTPEILGSLSGSDSINVSKIIENRDVKPIELSDLPDSYQIKFLGKDGSLGEFGFIFPSFDIDDGIQCRNFMRSLNEVSLSDGSPLKTAGEPVTRAALLDLSLPWLGHCTMLGCMAIMFWLFLFQEKRNRIFLILVSPAFGFLWFFGILCILGISLTFYNILAISFLIGISIDGSLFLWQRYWEEGTGSLPFVYRKTGRTVAISYLMPTVAFSSLCFSSHLGLRNLGIVMVIGILSIVLAHIAVFPIVALLVDNRRYRNRQSAL
ncbi:MAG: MMPL family transporter [Fibromonadaceae bacterium]|jgi:predicted RND superfamily exporter protein|nr:MMPL family transporter [Fibromonadaceae bacterium]